MDTGEAGPGPGPICVDDSRSDSELVGHHALRCVYKRRYRDADADADVDPVSCK